MCHSPTEPRWGDVRPVRAVRKAVSIVKKRIRVVALLSALLLLLSACRTEETRLIDSHVDGQFVEVGSTVISGTIDPTLPPGGTLTVDGAPVDYTPIEQDPNRSWTTSITVEPGETMVELEVVYTRTDSVRHRQMVRFIVGPSIPDTLDGFSPDGVSMRFTNAGLAGLGPIIQDLSSGSFDLDSMLVGQVIPTDIATATIYEAGAGNIELDPTVTQHGVRTVVVLNDLYLGLNLTDVTIVGNCRLDVVIPKVTIDGYFDLTTYGDDTGEVDVNLLGGTPGATNGQPNVTIPTVQTEFTSGSCDPDSFLGPIVGAIAGDTSNMIRDAFGSQLGDPDGAGPLDSPIADAVETALAGISIAGPVGGAVGANLQAPLIDVIEDADGMTFRSDANFGTIDPETNLRTCAEVPGAPDLLSTADLPSGLPSFGATTPGGHPYGLGLGISSSAFNQMLGAMTECGLLNSEVNEFLGLPITASLLRNLMPKFGDLDQPGSDALFQIQVRPTAAPYLTGNPGPNGEPAELRISNLALDFIQIGSVEPGGEVVDAGVLQGHRWMTIAIDAPFGFDLGYDDVAGELKPTLTLPEASQVNARITYNRIQQPEASAEALFQSLFPTVAAGMTESFSAFPLPEFMGLSIEVIEVAEQDNVWMLYANLNAAAVTKLANFTITDQSTSAWEEDDSLSSSSQWRYRIKKGWNSTGANVNFQSSLNADSIIAANKQAGAKAKYTLAFDVIPAPGKTWKIDLQQRINGAMTCVEEGGGGGRCYFGFQSGLTGAKTGTDGPFTNQPIRASVQVGAGTPQTFNFNAPSTRDFEGNRNDAISGSNSLVITGTTQQRVTVVVEYDQRVQSRCGGFLCLGDGHEASLRMGVGDTISNSFTAGEYPGQGSRDAKLDGHFLTVALSEL